MSFNNANTIPRISAYIDRVQRVTDAGGTVTKAYDDAVTRWRDWAELRESSPLQALTDAYEAGATIKQLATLRAAALADQATNAMMEADVHAAIAPAAYASLTQGYHATREANYETLQAAFNTLADEFTALTEQVDVEADARAMVAANEETRTAWLHAELLTHQLDQALAVLLDAAVLCGHAITTDADKIGLIAQSNGAHVRRVYEALNNTTNRCGKWSAFTLTGSTIQAINLDDHKPFTTLLPMETRAEHTGMGIRQYTADPHDDNYTEANSSRVTML